MRLSRDGCRQTEALAGNMSGEKIDKVYSSDLRRARQAAAGIARRLGLPLLACRELREIHFGHWDEKTYAQIIKTYSAS